MKNKPLKLGTGNWRSRWLVCRSHKRLHRISKIRWRGEEEKINGRGTAVCGLKTLFAMPGIFSRIGLERCAHCCSYLRMPKGVGNPFNEGIKEDCDKK